MLTILLTTIITSAIDSLNPIALTQQFVLQGLVKKPWHIWYFIIPTGVVNLIGGLLAYFGLAAIIGRFFGSLLQTYGHVLFTVELLLGLALLCGLIYLLVKKKLHNTPAGQEEKATAQTIRSVSPIALIALGAGATISELSTALPYFAFLAFLLNHQLTLPQLFFVLILYNIIYMSPLMLLYVIYVKARQQFDKLYLILKIKITQLAKVGGPVLLGIVAIVLIVHAVTQLFL